MQPLFWCQPNLGNNLIGHLVFEWTLALDIYSSIDSLLPVSILGHFEVQESGHVKDHRQNGDGDDDDQDAPRVDAGAGHVGRQHRVAD